MPISIITATYNSGGTIRDTLKSVLRQTYKDIEYIIVDGGSKDSTLDIIREYEPRFGGRMRWISEPDEGIYDAMNKGIRMATGEVIGILNSDDFYASPDVLERVAQSFAEDDSLDAVYGDVRYVDAVDTNRVIRYYSSRIVRPWLMRFGFMPAHPSFYCRREVYECYGLYDTSYRIAADFELLLRMIHVRRIKTRYLPFDFVTMRMGGASSSGLSSYLVSHREHMRAYRENGVYSNVCFDCLRYGYKVGELAYAKLRRPKM